MSLRTWRCTQIPFLIFTLFLLLASSTLLQPTHASPLHLDSRQPNDLLLSNHLVARSPLLSLLPPLDRRRTGVTLVSRANPVIVGTGDKKTVVDADSRLAIAQGSASDGGGRDLDAPALIWVGFCFVVGLPMAAIGIRAWRFTLGIAVGLAGSVASWAALVNSLGPKGVSDLAITLIVLGFFLGGFLWGFIPYGRLTGLFCIGFEGGLAFGIRLMIIRPGLLLQGEKNFKVVWALTVVFGVLGAMVMIWGKTQRWALLFGCTSIGSFLTFLGVDLLINKQSGMSRGLRFLFDRNDSHHLDLIGGGYNPPMITIILIGASLGAIPILSILQGWIFKAPFDRRKIGMEAGDETESKGKAKDNSGFGDDPIKFGRAGLPRASDNIEMRGKAAKFHAAQRAGLR